MEQVVLPKAEFIEDVEAFLKGKNFETVMQTMTDHRQKFKMLESQMIQRKAQLMGKLPEIQKALDIVVALIAKADGEVVLDYELAESVYAKTKVSNVKTVNLWLGADVMVEYALEEAKELLEANLNSAKTNLKAVERDVAVIRDNVTTLDVSISRVWNHDVEQRRLAKGAASAAVPDVN